MHAHNHTFRNTMLAALVVMASSAAIVQADWNIGDPYKMHYPQLPDMNGTDVAFTDGMLADDWLCTESGPVSDIHLWVSWKDDRIGQIQGIGVSIWSDEPASPTGAFSHPKDLLWQGTFGPGGPTQPGFTVRHWGDGLQGWLYPPTAYTPANHFGVWQVNIDPILDPFIQVQGTIYWLGVQMFVAPGDTGLPQPEVGWKTSRDHFNDDAVFAFVPGQWQELFEPPIFQESADLAFVITPEPTTLVLLGLGGLAALRRRGA